MAMSASLEPVCRCSSLRVRSFATSAHPPDRGLLIGTANESAASCWRRRPFLRRVCGARTGLSSEFSPMGCVIAPRGIARVRPGDVGRRDGERYDHGRCGTPWFMASSSYCVHEVEMSASRIPVVPDSAHETLTASTKRLVGAKSRSGASRSDRR